MKRCTARKAIRKHIANTGNLYSVEITKPIVKYWWKRLNSAVFYNSLTEPTKIVCKNFHSRFLGWCQPVGNMTSLNVHMGIRRIVEDRKIFLSILAHEMVHQYEWTYYGKMTHTETFYEWKPRLKWTINIDLEERIPTTIL